MDRPTIRTARQDDLERLLEIHLAAYPDVRAVEARARNFVANPFGGLEHLLVAEVAGTVVAHAFAFPFTFWFGQAEVPGTGIASVAVAPEARGRGLGSALVEQAHAVADERGDAIAVLYAFRQGFYARLGYAVTVPRVQLTFDPASVPAGYRDLARMHVRRARGDAERLRACHTRAAMRATGGMTRTDGFWIRQLARERRQTLVAGGPDEVRGYVAFAIEQAEDHGKTRALVEEIVADDDVAFCALLGAIGMLSDQVSEAVIDVDHATADLLALCLVDADRRVYGTVDVEHPLGVVTGGPMVRVVDIARAVEARGYVGDLAFDLVVGEEAMAVTITDGRAKVGAARGSDALRTTRRGLGAVLFGGFLPSAAVRLGLAEVEPRILARLDAALALPPPGPADPF